MMPMIITVFTDYLDALIDYSFNGNLAGKNVALGNGPEEQITMPSYNGQALAPLEVTKYNPSTNLPSKQISIPL